MTLPLEGIRVLELHRYSPGQFCSLFLADFGAEVIKVEEPAELRWGQIPNDWERRPSLNRNKKSLVLNLKAKEGKEVFFKLAKTADVAIVGYRPRSAQKLGLDYESLQKVNPRLIYCSITGFGLTGPYRDRSAHDINYTSLGGFLSINQPPGQLPTLLNMQIGNLNAGGLMSAIGILLALQAREKTGQGQLVDISILAGILSWFAGTADRYFATSKEPPPGRGRVSGGRAFYNIYQTKEGRAITLGCTEPWLWANFCRAIKREDLIPLQHEPDKLQPILKEFFLGLTLEECQKLLWDVDTCYAPVNSLFEAFSDPQVWHRRMVMEVEHPRLGKIKQIGLPIWLSETPATIRRPAPTYGEHTDEILRSLGYSAEAIRSLRAAQVVA